MASIPLLVNILFAILLLVGGLIQIPTDSSGGVPDEVMHGSAYGLQTVLLFWYFAPRMRRRRAIIAGVVCATLFGAMVETLQFLQPARVVELGDFFANAIGACIAGTGVALVGRNRS